MPKQKLTNVELNKHITATAAARKYWKDTTTPAPALHRRIKGLYRARGWAWPVKWTGRGRRTEWYSRAGNTVDIYGGGTEPQPKG
jgi:hypothetical protein